MSSKIQRLRELSGCGMIKCSKALNIFNNNLNQAYEYLLMRNVAVCRRKPDGTQWTDQDYIDWVKEQITL